MLKRLIKILKNKNFELNQDLIDNFETNSIIKDAIYEITLIVFESNKIDHPTRLKCHQELIKIAKQKKCNFSIAHNLNLTSRVYSVLGQNNKALTNDLEALKIWKNLKGDPLAINGQINSYANLGSVYLDLGLYKKSLDYFYKGLKALKKCKNDLIPYIRIHLGLGNVYNQIKRYKKAETFFIKAYNESKKTKNNIVIIPCELGLVKTKMNSYDYNSVIVQCKKIIMRLNKINDVNYKTHIFSTLGNCYMALKKYKESEKYFLENLNFAQKMKSNEDIAISLMNLGKLYYKMKKFNQSLIFFKKSYKLHLEQNSIQVHFEIIKFISLIYGKNRDSEKSLTYYKKYVKQIEKNNKEKDKLFKEDKRKIISSLESELDIIKKEKLFLNKDQEKNRLKNSNISISLLDSSNKDFLELILKKIQSPKFDKNSIIQDIKTKLYNSVHWIDYLEAFEKLNKSFMIDISKYKLSVNELKICTFIKIGFDNYEIAGIMGVGLRAVQQHRYRIKKKLGINQRLDNFIFSI